MTAFYVTMLAAGKENPSVTQVAIAAYPYLNDLLSLSGSTCLMLTRLVDFFRIPTDNFQRPSTTPLSAILRLLGSGSCIEPSGDSNSISYSHVLMYFGFIPQ